MAKSTLANWKVQVNCQSPICSCTCFSLQEGTAWPLGLFLGMCHWGAEWTHEGRWSRPLFYRQGNPVWKCVRDMEKLPQGWQHLMAPSRAVSTQLNGGSPFESLFTKLPVPKSPHSGTCSWHPWLSHDPWSVSSRENQNCRLGASCNEPLICHCRSLHIRRHSHYHHRLPLQGPPGLNLLGQQLGVFVVHSGGQKNSNLLWKQAGNELCFLFAAGKHLQHSSLNWLLPVPQSGREIQLLRMLDLVLRCLGPGVSSDRWCGTDSRVEAPRYLGDFWLSPVLSLRNSVFISLHLRTGWVK